MRSYLLKNNFKRNLQKHHFVYFYEVIIKYYLNFITCLYLLHPLIRLNSSHCHLMELFKSKESFKEKIDSNNNWKTAWPRVILESHLFLRFSLGIVWKMLSFMGKHLSFYPKDACSFPVILFKWIGVKPTCIIKYVENEISNSTSHKKKKKKRRKSRGRGAKKIQSKTPENCHKLLIITNYHFYHLWSDRHIDLKNKH